MNQTGQIVFIVFIVAYMVFWGTIICIGIPKEERRKQHKSMSPLRGLGGGDVPLFNHKFSIPVF